MTHAYPFRISVDRSFPPPSYSEALELKQKRESRSGKPK